MLHNLVTPLRRVTAVLMAVVIAVLGGASLAAAESYVPVSGAGSTWSQNALDQWRRNVNQYGLRVNYQGTGSSDGRNQFRNGTVDFAVSEIPYGLKDNGVVDEPPNRKYAYMPIVAGGTSFMYNLKVGGRRVTNLRLSGENITKLFTGVITRWDDPALKKDNPGLALPARKVVPVVRSDGSGTTAQFTLWMSKTNQALWDGYCKQAGVATPCGLTSEYPVVNGKGFVALSGSLGVSGYVAQSQSEGAITYVEYSYALNTGFPVVKVLNAAGYYNEPTASNVAVALLKAKIAPDLTQILDGVYANPDPRTYPLSSYSYMIVPTETTSTFSSDKGKTLGAFGYYFLCEGQQQAPALGYSPLPINLVRAGLDQVRRIPGVDVQSVDLSRCNNPTFSSDGTNTLAKNAPQPSPCDKQGATQCATGTGGARRTPTAVSGSGQGASTTSGGGSTTTAGGSRGGTGTAGGQVLTPGTTGGGVTVDPTTGQPVVAGAPVEVAAEPVSLAASLGAGSQRALVAAVVVVLLGIVIGPPLLSRRLEARRRT